MTTFMHTGWYKLISVTLCVAVFCMTFSPRLETRAAPAARAALPGAALKDILGAVNAALPADWQTVASVPARALPAATTAPPLTVGRVQSAATVGATLSGTLTVTFTVSNRLTPARAPSLAASADLTATVAALQSAAAAPEVNTLHNVLLADTLLAGATVLDATPQPDRHGDELAWNLGDVPPLTSITVTLVLSAPTALAGATALDTGARAWGTLYNDPVDAQTCPVLLWPDALGGELLAPYLQATVDANFRDPAVAQQTAGLCTGADALTFAQTHGYEAYKGSLRGARGTLWSAAGNSLDQANLLVATLRGSGIPARYRHGTLDDARAAELLLSMFPTTGAVVGYVPEGAAVADPAHDAALLAEARDHWWVEAYQDGAWVALDPSFDYAVPGQTFAAPAGDPLAEVPAALRHTVTLRLEAERYAMLSYLHTGFTYFEPLTLTFTTAELVGQPLALKFLVNAQRPPLGCMVFCWVHYTYVPYLRVGDMTEVWMGHQFWELLSDYPFGQFAVTGLWLHLDVQDAEGRVTRYTRELADRVGIDQREAEYKIRGLIPALLTAEVLQRFGPDTPALAHALDNHTLYFNPSLLAPEHAAQAGQSLLAAAPRMLAAQPVVTGLGDIETVFSGGTLDVSGRLALAEVSDTVEDTTQALNRLLAASFVALSDQASADLAATGLVKAYPDSPRITIASTVISPTAVVTQAVPVLSLDLLHDSVRVLAYPGQARNAEKVYRLTRGITEKFLEQQVGEGLIDTDGGTRVYSVAGILQAAVDQGIPLVAVDADHLDVLARTDISEEAQARIVQAVQQGDTVLVPKRMVQYNGAETVAWWQIDPETGETVGVGENGTHQFLVTLPAAIKLFVIVITIVLIVVLCRYVMWDRAAEATWAYFFQHGAPGEQNADLQQNYQEAWKAAKQYMSEVSAWNVFWGQY